MGNRIYLAGPVRDVADGGSGWRDRLSSMDINESGTWREQVTFVNPLGKYDSSDPTKEAYADWQIVSDDLSMIRSCDGMLVHIPDDGIETWGTPMEMVYASELYDIPVSLSWGGDKDVSPWAQIHSNYTTGPLSDAANYLVDRVSAASDRWTGIHHYEPSEVSFFNRSRDLPRTYAGRRDCAIFDQSCSSRPSL